MSHLIQVSRIRIGGNERVSHENGGEDIDNLADGD